MKVEAEFTSVKGISGQSQFTSSGLMMGMGLVIDNFEDIANGNFDIPAETSGIKVTTSKYDILTFEGHKYSRFNSEIADLYVKEDKFYSTERVKKEFGDNSDLYKQMQENEAEFIIKMTQKYDEQDDYYTNLANYSLNEIVVVNGSDRQYKEVARYKTPQKRVSLEMKHQMN